MKVLTADQIRKWDEFTIVNEPISSLDLMERAASKCCDWLNGNHYTASPVKIFCGKGNNGGDGLAIARLLAEKNITIDVYIVEFGVLGTDDFQANLTRLHAFPVKIHFLQHPDFFPSIDKNDVVIDALFGTGINRTLNGLYAELVDHINESGATIISIDIPSGLFSDKPTPESTIVKAGFTLTFQCLKMCFLFPENEEYFGQVIILNIGLNNSYLANVPSIYVVTDPAFIKTIYRPRKNFSHKGTFGHALIIAGENGKMGAAILATTACLRAGAGLVSALVPQDEFSIIQTAVPEAMAMPQEETEQADFAKYTTIGLGPGLGTKEAAARLIQKVLSQFNKPIVADADALNILSANQELLGDLPPGSILTPHPKEFERLFGQTANHAERIQRARYYAQKLFVYIIIKGHNSVLACPDGEVYFNNTGNAGMATGGSGDVLTGIITGLLAQNYSSKEACLLGMYIHGDAADIAVQSISQESLIAGDIISFLGKSFLSLSCK
jgi:NAD(P)H-hydrate epimerase